MAGERSSREVILSRIRAANGGALEADAAAAAWGAIGRSYGGRSAGQGEATLELLEDRLRDYDAHVFHATRVQLPELIERRLRAREYPRMILAPGFPSDMLPASVPFAVDEHFSAVALDRFEGVLTTATLGIAETGTLVLQNVPGQGRRALTLVPDFHLCVLHVKDVVHTVSEAIDRLRLTSVLPTTFISGPSATADIEMTRIKGVHGPRFLEVILFSP